MAQGFGKNGGMNLTTRNRLFRHVFLAAVLVIFLAVAPVFRTFTRETASHGTPGAVPADRLNESWWAERHKAVVDAARIHPGTQLLLIGDSITDNYDKANQPDENSQTTWKQFYEPRKALNLGFSGDTTANVLWRLDHGEVDGLHPKAVVLLIGTNRRAHQCWSETVTGLSSAKQCDRRSRCTRL